MQVHSVLSDDFAVSLRDCRCRPVFEATPSAAAAAVDKPAVMRIVTFRCWIDCRGKPTHYYRVAARAPTAQNMRPLKSLSFLLSYLQAERKELCYNCCKDEKHVDQHAALQLRTPRSKTKGLPKPHKNRRRPHPPTGSSAGRRGWQPRAKVWRAPSSSSSPSSSSKCGATSEAGSRRSSCRGPDATEAHPGALWLQQEDRPRLSRGVPLRASSQQCYRCKDTHGR